MLMARVRRFTARVSSMSCWNQSRSNMVATGNSQPSKLTNRDRVQEDSCNVHSGAFHSDCLTFCFSTAWGQTNACDLTGDRVVNTADVQAAINISLGISPCTAN